MVEKKIAVDLIEVVGTSVQVRTRTSTIEDGVEISFSLHRQVIAPGECGEDQDDRVKAVCSVIHTPSVVEAYQAEQARVAAEAEANRIKAEQQAAEAKRIADEQAAAQAAAEKAAFDDAVRKAVEKIYLGG